MTDIAIEKQAPEGVTKPAWGLTWAIPDTAPVSWGARAIYGWRDMRRAVLTKQGKPKTRHGITVTETIYRPVIELLWDRQGFAADAKNGKPLAEWIENVALPKLRELCEARGAGHPAQDGPSAIVEFVDEKAGFAVKASPNGSHGYLYIAAWKVP